MNKPGTFQPGFDPRRHLTGSAGSKHFTTIIKDALKVLAKVTENGEQIEMTKEQMLATAIVNRAIRKSDRMAELIWAYYDGKPVQGIMLGSDPENPVQVHVSSVVRKVYGRKPVISPKP